MVANNTFHPHHWSLVVGLSIIQGCINLWHAPSHIIDCGNLLEVVDPPIVMFAIWASTDVLLHNPNISRVLFCVISLTWGCSNRFISTIRGGILMIHTFSRKAHLKSFPRVLKSWGFKALLFKSQFAFLFSKLYEVLPCAWIAHSSTFPS